MSMAHKAFAFDWRAFEESLLPIIESALCVGEGEVVKEWCVRNRALLVDPYEGQPLPEDWESHLEVGDVQELADYALTAFYDPCDDLGLGDVWLALDERVDPAISVALLGEAVGPAHTLFDPGRMGSYFVRPDQVKAVVDLLRSNDLVGLQEYAAAVERACVSSSRGLYVTF